MTTKTRVPNKVIWALEDLIVLNKDARGYLDQALDRATNRFMDPILMMSLGNLSNALAKMDVKVREARQGEYSDECKHRD